MNKIGFFRLSILAGIFLFGCKAQMMDYEGKAGVYFAVQHPWASGGGDSTSWEYSPKTEVPFIMTTSTDSVVGLKVKLLGNLVNNDRNFRMVIVDSGTTAIAGTDYDVPQKDYVLAANTSTQIVYVNVHKASSLKDTQRTIMIELVPTADFQLPINTWYPAPGQYGYSPKPGAPTENISAIRHTIVLSDVITSQPAGWLPGFFGDFSREKYNVLCDWFDLSWDDFSRVKMDPNRSRALGQKAKYRLEELQAAGNPVLEADGTPMKMGPLV